MISGLVIHLSTTNDELAQEALQAIAQHPDFELGPRTKGPQPAVLETETSEESQQVTNWLNDLSGVAHVDVAFVHLEEATVAESAENSPTIK